MNEKQKQYTIMGLAMGLPSTIIAVAVMASKLVDGGYISESVALGFVILVVVAMFFLMIKYAIK
jgi:hypothetical protein